MAEAIITVGLVLLAILYVSLIDFALGVGTRLMMASPILSAAGTKLSHAKITGIIPMPEFFTIVEYSGTYQIRASIETPEKMTELVEQLKETLLKFTIAYLKAKAEKPSNA